MIVTEPTLITIVTVTVTVTIIKIDIETEMIIDIITNHHMEVIKMSIEVTLVDVDVSSTTK